MSTSLALYRAYKRARMDWLSGLALSLLGMAAIVVYPKAPANHLLRLGLTVGFFGLAALALWSGAWPLCTALAARLKWRYEAGGPALSQAIDVFIYHLRSYLTTVVGLALLLLVVTALRVLAVWPELAILSSWQGPLTILWWISFLALPGFLIYFSPRLSAVFQRAHLLGEVIATSGVVPHQAGRMEMVEKAEVESPVIVTAPFGFRAGGFDWHWDDFYKSAIVFGQTGSGKTVCVLNALLDGLLRSGGTDPDLRPAALILDPKGDFLDKIRTLCGAIGREQDLLVFDPQMAGTIHWNPLDSEDDVLELASRFAAVTETISPRGQEDSFWIDRAKTFIRHAVALLRFTDPGTPPSLSRILELATSDKALSAQLVSVPIGNWNAMGPGDPAYQAEEFFSYEWPEIPDKTKGSIIQFISTMCDPFTLNPYRSVLGGKSTCRIADMIDGGRILYVHMPLSRNPHMSRVVNTFIKLEYFREVLNRPGKKRPSLFFCDEFQTILTAGNNLGDADQFERTRGSRHANIIATQNLPALLKQVERPDPVNNLLGNCGIKIFLRNTDTQTNDYAEKLFGQRLETTLGSQASSGGLGAKSALGSGGGASSSVSYAAVIRGDVFTTLPQPFMGASSASGSIAHIGSRAQPMHEHLSWRVHPLTETGRS